MSIKTIRKRIALVAVSTLAAGALSAVASAPAANAAAGDPLALGNVFITPAAAGSNEAVGQCVIAATARAADTTTINSTGTVIAVGTLVSFGTQTNSVGKLTVTGPARFYLNNGTPPDVTLSGDAKSVTIIAPGLIDTKVADLEVTGAGDITVVATTAAGVAVETTGITGVDSCGSSSAPAVANSFFSLAAAADQEGAATDATLTAAQRAYGVPQYISVELKNVYKGDLTGSAGLLTAEGTGAVVVGVDGAGVTNMGFLATKATDAENIDIVVAQNTVLAPGAPLSTTITIKYNGATLATKSLTFHGIATSIVVDEVTIGASNATGSFKFLVKDAAGNNLDTGVGLTPGHASITAATAGFVSAGIVTSAAGTGASSGTTKATGTFACVAAGTGTSGSQQVTLGAQVGVTLVKSNAFTATCADTEIRTWTASMDKAVYAPGEIATLTITAKDRNGAAVADTAVVGAAITNLSIPGMSPIGAAAVNTDVFTGGNRTYRFSVLQAEGNFVGQAQVTVGAAAASSEKVVKTLQYSVKQPGTAVTNAEVLAAIVKLIASINKQIAKLQKLIKK